MSSGRGKNPTGFKSVHKVPTTSGKQPAKSSATAKNSVKKVTEVSVQKPMERLPIPVQTSEDLIILNDEVEIQDDPNPIIDHLDPYDLIESFPDTSQSYSIYKLLLCMESLTTVKDLMGDHFNLIALYGHFDFCRLALERYFRVSMIRKPSISEGVVLYYNQSEAKGALCYISNDIDLLQNKPLQNNNRAILMIKLLADISPMVILYMSDYDLENFSVDNPFAKAKHKQREVAYRTIVLEKTEIEKFTELPPDQNGFNGFITKDDYHHIICTKLTSANIEKDSKVSIMKSFDKFIKGVLTEDLKINEFNVLFLNMSNEIEKILQVLKLDYNYIQEELLKRHKEYLKEIKVVIGDFFQEIESAVSKEYYSLAKSDSNFAEVPLENHMSMFKNEFLNMTGLKNIKKVLNKFIDSHKLLKKLKKPIEKLIDSKLDEYKNKLKVVSESSNHELWTIFNSFIERQDGIQFNIKITPLTFIESSDLRKFRIEPGHLTNIASIRLKSNEFTLKQILMLSADYFFILFKNDRLGITQVYRTSAKVDSRVEVTELQSFDDNDVMIAWGSTLNKFFLAMNTKRKVLIGSAAKGLELNRGSIFLEYNSDISYIKCINFAAKFRKLFFLNQEGTFYTMDTVTKDALPQKIYKQAISKSDSRSDEKEPLKSTDGSPYIDLQVSLDENTIVLRSEFYIECFDMNFCMTHSLRIDQSVLSFKLYSFQFKSILLLKHRDRYSGWGFSMSREVTEKNTTLEGSSQIANGNPTIDVWESGIRKFGKTLELNKIREERTKFCVCFLQENQRITQIQPYVNSLKGIHENYDFLKVTSIEDSKIYKNHISKSIFFNVLYTRLPIHLASIQTGNLVPLQNGIDNFQEFTKTIERSKGFIFECVHYIKLGHLEEFLMNIHKGIRIVSIIGRQSSGKSYLLNRIFGTRFDVGAQRCTEGIWMSAAFLQGEPFVVFDCEGLFSTERSSQEEMKLSLFLAAMSDVVILNSDISSSRYITQMFDGFSHGIDRLNGDNLFKGKLEFAVRDVGSGQDNDAYEEILNFINIQREDDKRKYVLKKMFNDRYVISIYHNFGLVEFDEELDEYSKKYIRDIDPRFNSGEELLLVMKTVLAQIFSDDEHSIDERTFDILELNLRKKVSRMLYDSILAKECLENIPFNFLFIIQGQEFFIPILVTALILNKKLPLLPFINEVKKVIPNEIIRLNHNIFYQNLDKLIRAYFSAKKEALMLFLESKYPKNPSLSKAIELSKLKVNQKIEKVSERHYICLRVCESCENVCTNTIYHSPDPCNCGTDHKCPFVCEICTDVKQPCSFTAGHKEKHICAAKKHTCIKKCMVPGCSQPCTMSPNHNGECRCSKSVHECGKPCKMEKHCRDKCRIDICQDHADHSCCQPRCPFTCIFCDRHCVDADHFHDINAKETFIHPKTGNPTKLHLCGNPHPCMSECESDGICNIFLENSIRVYSNSLNNVVYNYVEQRPEKKKCAVQIPIGKYKHTGSHICEKAEHRCTSQCQDCSVFCKHGIGHRGLHSSNAHRNKDRCIYISTKSVINREIDKEEGTSTLCKFQPGESSQPEHCDSCCLRNGRGHTHPVLCPGGKKCNQHIHPGYAVHSRYKYNVGEKEEPKDFDLFECSTYWRLSGWEPPVFSINPKAQEVLDKCEYYCSHESHDNNYFCEQKKFHSLSDKRGDHHFPECIHSEFLSHDVIFVIDITGSMGTYLVETQNVIRNLIEKWKSAEDTRFGIVGYTDHAGDSGILNRDNPVIFYPNDANLVTSSSDGAIAFLNSLKTSGGGGMKGEAMIDGIYQASKFKLREASRPIWIIAADDCPHGREFADGTTYPDGCPCKISWRSVLRKLKTLKCKVIFIKLNDLLNTTVKLFGDELGGLFTVSDLSSAGNFQLEVVKNVSKIIQNDLEFSRGGA